MHRPLRLLADQAFARTAGAPLVDGNAVRLLKDGCENYPAWLDAIRTAQHWIHFETYILHEDKIGKVFAEALCERARAGVKVRLLIDWFGNMMKTVAGILADACGRPASRRGASATPRIDSPLGWVSRDHRKSLIIDGRVAFVSGLCVGDDWTDDGHEAQRDTGVMIQGPAVADVEAAFAEAWATTGRRVPAGRIADAGSDPAGRRRGAARHRDHAGHLGRLQARSAGGVGRARNVVGHRRLLRRRVGVHQRVDRRVEGRRRRAAAGARHGRRVRRRRHEPGRIPRACSRAASASSSGTA